MTAKQTRTKSSSSPKNKPPTPDPGPGTPSSSENQILEWIDENFEIVIYPTGFEDCIVGVGERFGGPPVAVLDIEKMLAKMEKEGMSHDEAIEYFEFNILGAHVGEQDPVYMHVPNFRVEKKLNNKRKKQKMTTNESNTSVQDYSEAMIRIQQLNTKMHKEIQAKDFYAARATARKIAVDAMLIGVWCKKFIDETAKQA